MRLMSHEKYLGLYTRALTVWERLPEKRALEVMNRWMRWSRRWTELKPRGERTIVDKEGDLEMIEQD